VDRRGGIEPYKPKVEIDHLKALYENLTVVDNSSFVAMARQQKNILELTCLLQAVLAELDARFKDGTADRLWEGARFAAEAQWPEVAHGFGYDALPVSEGGLNKERI